jgi:glycosyltransferase involved in cell wall biosynthesis
MRIAHVHQEYLPQKGGVAVFMSELCERLSRKGFEIVVYTLDRELGGPRRERIRGVLVKRYRSIIGDPMYVPSFSFLRDLKKEHIDLVHVHNIHTFPAVVTAFLKNSDQKLVVQPHYHRFGQTKLRNALFSLYKRAITGIVFRRANVIVVNSPFEERLVRNDFGFTENVLLVPQGLPIEELKTHQWNPESSGRILHVGVLRGYKNVDKLLRAFKILLDDNLGELRLVIIGDGPEKERLKSLTNKLELGSVVEWKQNLSNSQLFYEYSRARVFVSLSRLESFSRVVQEALIIGVPTVTLMAGIASDFVSQGVTIGTKTLNPTEIAAAIRKAMTQKPISTLSQKFKPQNIDDYANQIAILYSFLTKNKSRKKPINYLETEVVGKFFPN